MTDRRARIPFLTAGWLCLAATFLLPVVAAVVLGGVVAAAGCVDAASAASARPGVCAAGGGVSPGFVAGWATALIAVLFVGLVATAVCGVLALRRRGEAPWFRPAALLATLVMAALPAAIAGISVATVSGAGPLNGATFAGVVGIVLVLVVGVILAAVARAVEHRRESAV